MASARRRRGAWSPCSGRPSRLAHLRLMGQWPSPKLFPPRASGVPPGFSATEGFAADELRAKAITRWIVSRPEKAAEAIVDAGLHGKAERYVPRGYGLAAALRVLAPALVRKALSGGAASMMTTR